MKVPCIGVEKGEGRKEVERKFFLLIIIMPQYGSGVSIIYVMVIKHVLNGKLTHWSNIVC